MSWKKAFRALLLANVAAGTATPLTAQTAPAANFDLPAQDLGRTLRAIAEASGREILFEAGAVEGRRAPAVQGILSADAAVRMVLAGTSLVAEQRAGAIIISTVPGAPRIEPALPSPDGTITVTGTRIRGAGSASPVTVATRRSLEVAGVSDLADFTRVLPQNYTGGQNRGIAGGGEQGGQQNLNNSASLNLRGLGPDATLTLLNGHRLSYDALDQGVDISAIPMAAIDRIEVVADGASALYGSDAVAGVANVILRRDFDGFEARARIGASTAGGNVQQQYNAVGGGRWSEGGIMLALDHGRATPINAGQRDYTRSLDPSFFLTDSIEQTSAIVAGHQEISRVVSVDIDATAMNRRSLSQNPFFPATDVLQAGIVARGHVRSWALAPALHARLGTWRASLSATLAESRTRLDASNYFNGNLTSGDLLYAGGLRGIEATGEGSLLALPGGDARLAVGGGLREISLHVRQIVNRAGVSSTSADFTEKRNVQFAYGELSLPLISANLKFPYVEQLTLTSALRHEKWNGIASVTTPKFGLIYQPSPVLTLRATWGRSFKVPTLLQVHQVPQGILLPGFIFTPPPQPAGSPVLLLSGSSPDLKPERAASWSGTVELRPAFVEGLDLRATVFRIDYRDRIAAPIQGVLTAIGNPLYRDLIVYNPSAGAVDSLLAGLPEGLVNQTGVPLNSAAIGAIIDSAIRNTQRQRIGGLDLAVEYRADLGSGSSLQVTGAASYLESDQQLAATQPRIQLAGTIFNPSRWRGRAGAVWARGPFGLSAFANYIGSLQDDRFGAADKVGAFVTLDVNASFQTNGALGLPPGIEVRFSALNLLNAEPEPIRTGSLGGAPYDSTNQSPVGRFVGVSVRKGW